VIEEGEGEGGGDDAVALEGREGGRERREISLDFFRGVTQTKKTRSVAMQTKRSI